MTLVPATVMSFQSTLSMRRATNAPMMHNAMFTFQSTLSMRRATAKLDVQLAKVCSFQSTLSMRRATVLGELVSSMRLISIHALREESDAR